MHFCRVTYCKPIGRLIQSNFVKIVVILRFDMNFVPIFLNYEKLYGDLLRATLIER